MKLLSRGKDSLTGDHLIELVPLDQPHDNDHAHPWHSPEGLLDRAYKHFWYNVCVVAPTLLAAIFFLFMAAERYETEVRFVVKSPNSSASTQLTSLVADTGIVRSNEDAYIVHAFLQSRDAVRRLVEDEDLAKKLSQPALDFVWGFPGLFGGESQEHLWRHFEKFISIDFDSSTGITILNIQAFRPEDSKAIAESLIRNSEQLVNSISKRAQAATLAGATSAVENSRERARKSLDDITAFRKRTALVDPLSYSKAALETITTLSVEIAQVRAELAQLATSSPNSPQAQSLRLKIDALAHQITEERAALAGSDSSLAPLIAEYERLSLEREFAERTFASAMTALEIARIDAERQQLYLDLISVPIVPDHAQYPYRLLNILLVFLGSSMAYSILRGVIGDTLSHAGN
ncbi:MAG: hypothetical protein APF80_16485 [Alphaproteobacteria bacterium BRH_c36]|nr:MAG: hypothetical protein APF80_16485 [Alphaproteobacteria bacterium BRH_c36]